MNDKRPVNLDLTTIKFPVPAIASIIHRITGVGLFVALPIVLWMLDRSLASPESFVDLQEQLSTPLARVVVWGIVSMFIYHLVAGIKHLLMDLGIGETLEGGRNGAFIVLATSAVLSVIVGVWV
ncbi:MAG: succinate dehydrogenase, cytochrome b556 subunit [Gammaproteobacteria bacterium]|nr:succinate dehydrogenase, cytochrome b556 subunit [Gammaproteobacteria bacterium]MBQ0773859.1 succinate dehydrogenase, cytochrome b556 subunit [Gammaproteobacteria bacterium]